MHRQQYQPPPSPPALSPSSSPRTTQSFGDLFSGKSAGSMAILGAVLGLIVSLLFGDMFGMEGSLGMTALFTGAGAISGALASGGGKDMMAGIKDFAAGLFGKRKEPEVAAAPPAPQRQQYREPYASYNVTPSATPSQALDQDQSQGL